MKSVLIALLAVFLVTPAYAERGRGHGEWRRGGEWRHSGDSDGFWILPAILTGAVIYGATRSRSVESAPTYAPSAESGSPSVSQPTPYWYYCSASKAYYPYVASCQSGWQKVPATPPAPAQ